MQSMVYFLYSPENFTKTFQQGYGRDETTHNASVLLTFLLEHKMD